MSDHACPGCLICLICSSLPEMSRQLNTAFGIADERFKVERVADLAAKLNDRINELSHESPLRITEVLAAVLTLAGFIADSRILSDEDRARFVRLADEMGPLISHYLSKQGQPPTIH
jgi:hypothetical protein